MSTELDATLPATEEMAFLDTPQDILADPDDQADLGLTPPETDEFANKDTPSNLPDMPEASDLSALPDTTGASAPDDLMDSEITETPPPELTEVVTEEVVTENDSADPEIAPEIVEEADETTTTNAPLQASQLDTISTAIAALGTRLDPVIEHAEQMRNSDGLATAATTFLRKLEILTASIAADHAKLSDRLDAFFAQQNTDSSALSSDEQPEPAGNDAVAPSTNNHTPLDAPTDASEPTLPDDPEVPTLGPVSETATPLMSMNDTSAPANASPETALDTTAADDAASQNAPSTDPEMEWTADAEEDAQMRPTHPEPANADESTDLNALPGAGEGLVWMLKKAGIESLEDLANADADALGQQLGIVSDILDLTYWIDQAQERSADLTSNAA